MRRALSIQSTIVYSRVVDLSHELHPAIPGWPGDPPVELEDVTDLAEDGYRLRRFSLGEHAGTHINSPAAFHQHGVGIEAYPASSLVVPAVLCDVSLQAAAGPDYLLTVEDVRVWEDRFGRVPSGALFLLHSGWQVKWDSPDEFLNLDGDGTPHFPGFGLDAARFLLDHRSVAGIGIDTHGVDGGKDQTFGVNRLALERPRVVLENLANLHLLPPTGATLVIGMLRLKGGTGSPASVLAFVP